MVVVDTDFFSSLFKISELKLILKLLNVDKIIIPSTVYEELKDANFFNDAINLFAFSNEELSKEKFVLVKKVNLLDLQKYFYMEKIEVLGRGEKGCLLIAKETNDKILMDDKCARKIAKEEGLKVLSIPSFLADCKRKNILSNEKLKQIIKNLKEKDYYGFSEEVESLLLA